MVVTRIDLELRAIVDSTLLRSLDHPLFSIKKKKNVVLLLLKRELILYLFAKQLIMLVNRRWIRRIYNGGTPLCIIVDLTLLRSLHSFSLKKTFSYRQNSRMS